MVYSPFTDLCLFLFPVLFYLETGILSYFFTLFLMKFVELIHCRKYAQCRIRENRNDLYHWQQEINCYSDPRPPRVLFAKLNEMTRGVLCGASALHCLPGTGLLPCKAQLLWCCPPSPSPWVETTRALLLCPGFCVKLHPTLCLCDWKGLPDGVSFVTP